MSRPANPLSIFRTYSYHHVLAVCDSALTAQELSESPALAESFISRAPVDRFEVKTTKSGGKYVVLIDGMADAQFVIQDVRWSTIIAPDSMTPDGIPLTTTIETDGEMKVLEPYGVRFMNLIAQTCSVLNADPVRLVFVLKTLFVGRTDGLSNSITPNLQEIISNVRPLMFILYDIQAEFSETGAEYTLGFVGLSNGVGKLPCVNQITSSLVATNRSLDGTPVSTLEEVFKVLETFIKREYDGNWNKLKNDYQKINADFDFDKTFQEVSYRFELDEAYRNYKFGTNEEVVKSNVPGEPILAFTKDTTVERIISEVMMSSQEVVKEANNPTEKYIFKISSSLESTPTKYEIVFHIHRYLQATPLIDQAQRRGQDFRPPQDALMEFDYIFSGKNVDIKNFDIKMEMGLAFFQTVATSKNIPNQNQVLAGTTDVATELSSGSGGGASGTKANSDAERSTHKTPLFLGGNYNNPLYRNKTRPVDTINFQSLLNRHAALENIIAKMTIHGNPQLLDEMSAGPNDFRRQQTEKAKEGQTINPRWMTLPTYLKVNIFMPSGKAEGPFAEKFWYEGFYQLLSVNNVFNDGIFEQELEMISLPFSDYLSTKTDDPPTTGGPTQRFRNNSSNNSAGNQTSEKEVSQMSTASKSKARKR